MLVLSCTAAACSSDDAGSDGGGSPSATPAAEATVADDASGSTGVPAVAIPQSDAVDALAANIAGNPQAGPVAAACTAMSAESSAVKGGIDQEADAAPVISALATAVRAIDPAVGDALASATSAAAADWCIGLGFAN